MVDFLTKWLVLKKGNVVIVDPSSDADKSIMVLFKDRKIIVNEILWGACYCECGRERKFDDHGTCLTCHKLCKQYLWIEGHDYKSEFFKLAGVAET